LHNRFLDSPTCRALFNNRYRFYMSSEVRTKEKLSGFIYGMQPHGTTSSAKKVMFIVPST
jgi:hypothetical protein